MPQLEMTGPYGFGISKKSKPMKKLLLALFAIPTLAMAQDGENYNYAKNIKVNVNQEPFYPDGEQKMYEYVFYNLDYSDEAQVAKVNGEVLLNFTVNADSTLSDFSVVKGVGYGIDEDIINLMRQLKFAPGKINGETVNKNILLSFPIEVE